MKRSLIAFSAATMLMASTAFASPLEQYMEAMNKNLVTFSKAKTNAEALTALNNIKIAANQAKTTYPRKVKATNAAQVKAYQSYYTLLNQQIDQATALVKANRLQDAQKYVVNIRQTEKSAHQKFR